MPPLYDSLLERMEGTPYVGYFSALCPFHDDSTPSFFVYEESYSKGWEFKCSACGKHGSLEYLDEKLGRHFTPNRPNNAVSRVLPTWRKWEQKYGDLEGIVDAAHTFLLKFSQAQKYFKERKIYEYAEEGSLGYLDTWACFPVYGENKSIIDIVVRSTSHSHSDIRYVVHPGNSNIRPLYVPSWKKVHEASVVYVVYGIIDSISLHLAGLPVVTGVTGKSLPPEVLRPLNKRFIIVPDAGEEMEAHKLANNLGWRARVKQVNYPEGTKDTDDIRRIYGNESLLQALA